VPQRERGLGRRREVSRADAAVGELVAAHRVLADLGPADGVRRDLPSAEELS
jgi:hypothetical protein